MPTVKTTEIDNLDANELHLVKRGANGFPPLFAKAAADEVEEVEKAKAKCKTCGDTGKIRDGHVKCPDCDGKASGPDEATKATLSAKDRDALNDSDFAYIDKEGERLLPIHDEGHVRAALGRFDETQFDNAADKKKAAKKILTAAKKFGIDVSEDGDVSDAAKSVMKAAEDDDPGSGPWEQADAQTMAEAAELLLQAADRIKVFIGRESEEVAAGEPGEYSDIWDGQDALCLVTSALGVVARLSMQEAHSGVAAGAGDAAKAGKTLSAKSKSSITAALSALKDLLTSAGEEEDSGAAAKSRKDILEMTKDELFAALDERDAAKAAAAEEATKAQTEAGTGETQPAAEGDATKSAVITLTPEQLEEVVAKGVAKAQAPLQERLETVEKMAAPGGPVKTRTPDALAKSGSREALVAQADEYERRANMTTDRDLRKGYLDKAGEARKAAAEVA